MEANESLRAGFHVHVAEDRCDVDDARRRYHQSPVMRLRDLGILDDRSLAAHCVHVSARDIAALARHQINVVHNPQSNCNNAVGMARLLEMFRQGVLVGLGSDGYTPRMWEEFKAAFHVQKVREGDPRVAYAEAYAAALLNNRTIAKKIWGWEIGRIETGARADLLLVDYYPADASRQQQSVRPLPVRHCQRAGGFAARQWAIRAAQQGMCYRGRARGGGEGIDACP